MQKCALFLMVAAVLAGAQSKPTTLRIPSGYLPVHGALEVLPRNKIEEIEESHLKNDDGFKAAVLYFQGEEWEFLVNQVMKSQEYEKFAEMAGKYKFNVSQAITCMKNHIGSLKVEPTKVTAKPNLEGFISDVQSVLPVSDIVKALSSPDHAIAKRVREEIGSKENQKIAEDLHNLPEMVKMREILKGMNFDVEPYIALVYTFLGWVH